MFRGEKGGGLPCAQSVGKQRCSACSFVNGANCVYSRTTTSTATTTKTFKTTAGPTKIRTYLQHWQLHDEE